MSNTNDFAQGVDPDINPDGEPEPELGAPGGEDSTVGTDAEGKVADPDGITEETGEFGPGVDQNTGANVGDTGRPQVGG
ncbi:hypothetical protein BH09ACT5_BH09ACT5_03130 [soil metagenome]